MNYKRNRRSKSAWFMSLSFKTYYIEVQARLFLSWIESISTIEFSNRKQIPRLKFEILLVQELLFLGMCICVCVCVCVCVRFSEFRKTLLWLPFFRILIFLESLRTFSTLELGLFSNSYNSRRIKEEFSTPILRTFMHYPITLYKFIILKSVDSSISIRAQQNENDLCKLYTNSPPFDLSFVFFSSAGNSIGRSKSNTETINSSCILPRSFALFLHPSVAQLDLEFFVYLQYMISRTEST